MNDEKQVLPVEEHDDCPMAQFIIDTIKDNPFAVTFSMIGLCIGILLDDKRKRGK